MPAPALGRRLVVKLKQRDAPDVLQASDRHASQREQLRAAVRAIQSASDTPATLEELFSAVENAVVDNEGHALHTLLGDECQRKAAADVAALAAGVALDSTTFLQHVVRLWEEYSSQLSLIRCGGRGWGWRVCRPCREQALSCWPPIAQPPPAATFRALPALCCCCRQVFLYLDRAYVVSNPGTLSVFQLGLRQLRSQLEALPHVSAASVAPVGRLHLGTPFAWTMALSMALLG